MRARTINEVQNFERGIDPKDSMNLGNPEVRKINSSLKPIQDIVSSGYNVDELDFPDIVEKIDNLKGMLLIVIKNYLKKNFGWEFFPLDEGTGEEALSADIGNGYELRIQLSNSLKSYVFKIYARGNYITSMPASTNLNAMNRKAKDIIKKFLK
jgi:hypothetical protein